MAQRMPALLQQHANSASALYAGGSLSFYASGTSTPLATYSDAGLSVANTIIATDAHLTLNSAGRPSVDVFLQNLPYKVTLRDSSSNVIWTADPVSSSDFASFTITKVGSGNPNGFVAGTAGSSGVLPTTYWDYTNSVMYFCTTTGVAAAAVWLAINASSTTAAILPPQGRLTLTSATPILTTEVVSATSVYYTPFVGNLVPLYNGANFVNTTFAELTLALVASHALSTIYDVFIFSDSGTVRVGTGPGWSVSTAGAGARGTGAGSTQLARLNGLLTNAQSMTARNGSNTYTVAGNYGLYVGSIFIDGTAGQVTCHNTYGQSRKWGVWNAFNRQRIYLKAGDTTASWVYTTNTIRSSNNLAANSLTVFQGLAEDIYDLSFRQKIGASASSGFTTASNGIGWNSVIAISGQRGWVGSNPSVTTVEVQGNGIAAFLQVPSLGINTVSALETAPNTDDPVTWFGGEDDMVLSALWWG